jgi:ketosteroid isomerase-like protein
MNRCVGALACVLALSLIQGCTGKEDTTSGEQKETGGGKTQEEVLLEKTIIDLANAHVEFPKTKDTKSILRFYSQDYAGINNGKSESREDIEKYLSDLIDRINLGDPIGIVAKVSNIKTSVNGTFGWATSEYEYKQGRGGAVVLTEQGKCTAVFRKQGSSWLIQHEHCSTESPPIFLR